MKKLLIFFTIIFTILILYYSFLIKKENNQVIEKNIEVFVISKLKIIRSNRSDYFLCVQALNEVKNNAVNLKEHSFIRNGSTMNENGSIKSMFIIKTYENGPKFKIKVDSLMYLEEPVGTRLIFKLSNDDM